MEQIDRARRAELRARPARTLCPFRRKARRHRAQSAPLITLVLVKSPGAGDDAGVASELDEVA